MDVFGVNNITGPKDSGRVKKVQSKKDDSSAANKSNSTSDNVVISDAAKSAFKDRSLINMVSELPEIRKDAVERAKKEISNGSLLSDEVIKKTADKILKGIEEEL